MKAKEKENKKEKEKPKESPKDKGSSPNEKPVENNEDIEKIDSEKGDFDPNEDSGREVVYIETLADLSEDCWKIMKRSKLPEEAFAQHLDVLLRVLSFVAARTNKAYRRRAWPDRPRREGPERIFLAPGKYFKFPDEVNNAKEKFCERSDPKALIKFGEFEGKGGFGRVFAGRIKNPHNSGEKSRVAVKVMPHKTEKEIRMNLNEVGLLSFCSHPNIVKFYRSYLHNEELWLLMEFLEGGTLREATSNFQFLEKHIAYVAKEMLKAIAYLHNVNIAHRDLKSANVMLSMKGEVKLIDFGLCADFSEMKAEVHMCGSPFWMSPEMINQQPHSLQTDIWSLSVCLVEMMNRKVPNRNSRFKAMFLVGSEGLTFSKEEYKWSSEFHDLLSKCLQKKPEDRPSAVSLLQHPFLKKAATTREMQAIMPAIFLSNTMTRQGLL